MLVGDQMVVMGRACRRDETPSGPSQHQVDLSRACRREDPSGVRHRGVHHVSSQPELELSRACRREMPIGWVVALLCGVISSSLAASRAGRREG